MSDGGGVIWLRRQGKFGSPLLISLDALAYIVVVGVFHSSAKTTRVLCIHSALTLLTLARGEAGTP